MPPSISGAGGHDALFRAAVALVRGFALTSAEALQLLAEYNLRAKPSWSRRDLERKLTEASRSNVPTGYLLGAERRRAG